METPIRASVSDGKSTFEFFDDFENDYVSGWTTQQSIPAFTADCSAAVYNNKLYVFGGYYNTASDILNIAYEYDPVSNTWTQKASMPTARWGEVAVQYNGKIYLFGGQGANEAVFPQNVIKFNGNPITTIPQYNSQGVLHPDVVYFPNGQNGYKYWMVYTPYTNPTQGKENPSIVRSNDGVTWTDNGVTNPVISPGIPGTFNDLENPDPDFMYVAELNKWFMVWAPGDQATDSRKIALAYSSNGLSWTQYNGDRINGNNNPIILSGDDADGQSWERDGTVSKVAVPTLFYENGVFYLYYAEEASGNNRGKVGLATFTWDNTSNSVKNLKRYQGNPIIDLPQDNIFLSGIGHLSIERSPTSNDYYMYGVRQLSGSSFSYELVLLISSDGVSWTYKGVVLETGTANEWDNEHIYRSAPTVDQYGKIVLFNDTIQLFYSGFSDEVPNIGVAYIYPYSYIAGNPDYGETNPWVGDIELTRFQFTGSTGSYTGNITVFLSSVASSPNNKAVVGLYDQTLNKIAESAEKTNLNVGWQTFQLTGSINLVQNSYYYLASQAPTGNNGAFTSSASSLSAWKTNSYSSTLPSNIDSFTGQEKVAYSIYFTCTKPGLNTITSMGASASFHSNEIYSPVSDSWTTGADVPSDIANQGLMGVLLGNQIHLFYKNFHYVYDPSTDSYSRKSDVPTPRTWGTCATINNKIYVVGGYSFNSPNGPTSVNEEYDPSNDQWQTKNPLPIALYGITRENPVINNRIYVADGQGVNGFYDTTFVYDPSNDDWTQKSSGSYPRDGVACGVISNKLYVVGGRNVVSGPYGLNFNEVYDPSNDIGFSWSFSDPSNVYRDQSANHDGNYGLLLNDNNGDGYVTAQRDLSPSQKVVDIDWELTDQLGVANLQPQGRILLVDPSLVQSGALYYYNSGGTPTFRWYNGTFTTIQTGAYNTWYHISIVWAGSQSSITINGNRYPVSANTIPADRIIH